MQLRIYIPTLARVGKQVTLSKLPPSIQEKVFLVCPSSEVKQHSVNAIVLPCDVKGIAAKRDWIMQHARSNGFKRIVMIDDDVVIQRRRNEKLPSGVNRIDNASPDEMIQAFKWLDDRLQKYAHASFAPRFLENGSAAMEVKGKRAMYLLGYNVDIFFQVKAGFGKGLPPMAVMEDLNVTLQLLKAGYPNVLSLEWRVSHSASNAPGGCSTWRTVEIHNASAISLSQIHKPFVKLRRADTLWKGQTEHRLEVTVQWRKAMEAGLASSLLKGARR